MALENEINQRKFRTEYQKARINIIYTYNWLSEKISSIFEEWDITPRQFNILRILRGEGKPLSTLQIRQRMLDKMSDTSRIVDRLLKKGLVRKTPNGEDRRLVDVVITSKGRKLLEKIDPFEEAADKIMTRLTVEETRTLNTLLDKLRSIPAAIFLFLMMAGFAGYAQSPKYEFRAAWVASVENIDWPSKKGLPVDSQKVEFTGCWTCTNAMA
jgi:DNA-binding MarR family transcriptional regulator